MQDVGENLPRDEKIAPALADENIADCLALDARAHERAEKITVREPVACKKLRADGGTGAVLRREPAFVQIIRQPAAHIALRSGGTSEEVQLRAAQELLRQKLFAR